MKYYCEKRYYFDPSECFELFVLGFGILGIDII